MTKCLSQNGRGLAHFAESSEQNVPVPLSADRSIACVAFSIVMLVASLGQAQTVDSLRVMTYNILTCGAAYGPITRTIGVIQTAQADVIGIQEVSGSAQFIANSLGFYYHGFNTDIAIISRYPIAQVLNQGVKLQISP